MLTLDQAESLMRRRTRLRPSVVGKENMKGSGPLRLCPPAPKCGQSQLRSDKRTHAPANTSWPATFFADDMNDLVLRAKSQPVLLMRM